MSCGRPHETPCDEVLARLYDFLDSELDTASSQQIQQHLEECAPCLAQAALDRMVKTLVARSCCSEPAPEQVRLRVVQRISEVRITYRYSSD